MLVLGVADLLADGVEELGDDELAGVIGEEGGEAAAIRVNLVGGQGGSPPGPAGSRTQLPSLTFTRTTPCRSAGPALIVGLPCSRGRSRRRRGAWRCRARRGRYNRGWRQRGRRAAGR